MTIFGLTILDIVLIGIGLILCCLALATAIRLYVRWTCVMFNSNASLSGKTIVVTGANSGIGKETAKYMAKRGARVIMACRNMSTAKIVRDEIATESENDKIVLHQVDLSSFQSVREFCEKIIATETKIDVLIHNAGYGSFISKSLSIDGIEYTMATNHYGPFLMTVLLSDLLKKYAPCRVIVVSSKMHTLSFLDPTIESHLNPTDYWLPLRIYANSKFANILFTFELARRFQGTGITVNALHPGSIDTEIWRNYPFPFNIAVHILRIFLRTIEEGTQTTLYVALSTGLKNVSGVYFRDCKPAKAQINCHNPEWQRLLFEQSKKIVGLTEKDPTI